MCTRALNEVVLGQRRWQSVRGKVQVNCSVYTNYLHHQEQEEGGLSELSIISRYATPGQDRKDGKEEEKEK